jgi:hypothetical protein
MPTAEIVQFPVIFLIVAFALYLAWSRLQSTIEEVFLFNEA